MYIHIVGITYRLLVSLFNRNQTVFAWLTSQDSSQDTVWTVRCLATVAIVFMFLGLMILTIVKILRFHFYRNSFMLREDFGHIFSMMIMSLNVAFITEIGLVILTVFDCWSSTWTSLELSYTWKEVYSNLTWDTVCQETAILIENHIFIPEKITY